MKMFRILALFCFMLCATAGLQQVKAQPEQTQATTQPEAEMADVLRADGKIYVVVAVLLTVLGGMVLYLVSIDRKVGKLEKQLKDELVNH